MPKFFFFFFPPRVQWVFIRQFLYDRSYVRGMSGDGDINYHTGSNCSTAQWTYDTTPPHPAIIANAKFGIRWMG